MNYYINFPKDNDNIAELWSVKRLPFEPKGWLFEMRESLKTAISQLNITDDHILAATYTSPIKGLCDVENILFYNVGTGRFKTVCQNGFLIERSFNTITVPVEKMQSYAHHQRYEFVSKNQQPLHWTMSDVLASWDHILLPTLTANSKPHLYWSLMKENPISTYGVTTYEGYFGIELELSIPPSHTFNFAAMIKPMLDGIISAFHSYQGEQLAEVSSRLSLSLSSQSDYISTLLLDTRLSILGNRCVLHPFLKNVQWNPADDKCVVIKLICNYCDDNEVSMMSGNLFKVK